MTEGRPAWWEYPILFVTVWSLVAADAVYRLVSGLRGWAGRRLSR